MRKEIKHFLGLLACVVAFLGLSNLVFKRFDFTKDKRYTLTSTSEKVLNNVGKDLQITVYLKGNFPASFKQLQNETAYLLEELKLKNGNIKYQFIDPIEEKIKPEELEKLGMQSSILNVEESGVRKEIIVYPYATIAYKGKQTTLPLVVSKLGMSPEQQLTASIENLEYTFVDAINKVSRGKKKTLGIITHHGELKPLYINGFLNEAAENYKIIPYILKDTAKSLNVTDLPNLEKIDALVIAKPLKAFTDNDKIILDQYIMNGGKTLWMLDLVDAEMDSIQRSGKILAYPRDINLTDFLFSYGLRVNPNLVKDQRAAPIRIATGQVGENTSYSNFNWVYFPLAFPTQDHPITKNINPVKFEFANQIDILPTENIKKTILLSSSNNANVQSALTYISLETLNEDPSKTLYNQGNIPLAVLMQGKFKSAYSDRIAQSGIPNYKSNGVENKMIVISDGDIAKNQTQDGKPLPLGYDKWVDKTYGNASFLMNSLEYLVDNNGLMNLRSRTIDLSTLDTDKVLAEKPYYQWLNILLPLLIICLTSGLFILYRKKTFAKI